MNAEVFAEWLRRRDMRVLRTESTYWYEAGKRVYQAFPYHWLVSPDEHETRSILSTAGAVALRYSTPLDAPEGMLSYHVVFDTKTYDFANLGRKARSDVRRGLKRCCVEPVSLERLASEGWMAVDETQLRQGRTHALTCDEWLRLCRAAEGLSGFEAWAALRGDEIAAHTLALRVDDVYCVLLQHSRTRYLKDMVNNALSYEFSRAAMTCREVRSVFYALHSLDAAGTMDEFKFRMGYRAKPVRQRVVFRPGLVWLVNPMTHALLRGARHVFHKNATIAKADGLVHFFRQGLLPAGEQEAPIIRTSGTEDR